MAERGGPPKPRGAAPITLEGDNPSMPFADAQQHRLLELLREAGEEPVGFAELRAGGISFPAAVVSELGLNGYVIERVHDHGRAGRGAPARFTTPGHTHRTPLALATVAAPIARSARLSRPTRSRRSRTSTGNVFSGRAPVVALTAPASDLNTPWGPRTIAPVPTSYSAACQGHCRHPSSVTRPFPSEANRCRQRLETANGMPALMPTARAPCGVCSTTSTCEAPRSSTVTSRTGGLLRGAHYLTRATVAWPS